MEQMSLFEDFGIFDGTEVEEPAADSPDVSETNTLPQDVPPFEAEEPAATSVKAVESPESEENGGETDGEPEGEPEDAEDEEEEEEDDEAEEGEVTASAKDAPKRPKAPLFGIDKAKAEVEEAKTEVEEAKRKAAELLDVPKDELKERALTKLKAQYDLSEKSEPQKFGYIRIIYPYLMKKAEEADFCRALLAPEKTFAGMFDHVFKHFKAKAKAEFDALPEEQQRKLRNGNGGMCYASADDTELFGPAEEYFLISEAEKKLAEAEKKLAELKEAGEKKKKSAGKSSKKPEKKAAEKKKEEPGFSLFDVMDL